MSDDFKSMTPEELEKLFFEYLDKMTPEDRAASEAIVKWMAYERPKDAEPVTPEKLQEWHEEYKRRMRGGRTAQILPFKKPGE